MKKRSENSRAICKNVFVENGDVDLAPVPESGKI